MLIIYNHYFYELSENTSNKKQIKNKTEDAVSVGITIIKLYIYTKK